VRIRLNGDTYHAEDGVTVAALIASLALGPGRIAVAVNGEVVPGSEHETHRLSENDEVELIHAVAGG
jgi:sulfur carrier protein